ncbi:uncharacterized protein J3R85_007399 [Psidium guajava]|nr:uncharacterized protein J3R85_007399 [Psidium guajava]
MVRREWTSVDAHQEWIIIIFIHLSSPTIRKPRQKITCRLREDQVPSDDFLGRSDCRFFLDTSCAQPPMEIRHYLHPGHPLTFAQCPGEKAHECPSCESPARSDSYCYTYQTGDFCNSARF